MLRVVLALVMIFTTAGPASANPGRVIIADPDPELVRAVTSALDPWHLEVIVDPTPPADTAEAQVRATTGSARFVVWRRNSDLVVFDRERGSAEWREGQAGPLDAVSAAAAALTVKTLMRLPPPDTELVPPPPLPESGVGVRLQAGVNTRVTTGSAVDLGARVVAAALVRPWAHRGWRFGIAGDIGTATTIENMGFKGRWNDSAVFALVSWTRAFARWELEPHVGGGIGHSTFDGVEGGMARKDVVTLASVRVGASARRRLGRWAVGGSLDLDSVFGTPTYLKQTGNGEIFAVPDLAVAIGLFVAADVGR